MRKYIVFILVLFIVISCGSSSPKVACKGEYYSISNSNIEAIFMVTEIQYNIDKENILTELIRYQLYQENSTQNKIQVSFVKYKRIQKENNSVLLEKINGSQDITINDLSFTWSYGSDDFIYLYLKGKCKVKPL